MDNMEIQQITDVETEASSEETLSDKPDILRARGRPNRSPRRESPGPEIVVETTGAAAENNGNDVDDGIGPIRTSGGSLSVAFLTANAANAAAHAACAASIAAHAANGAAAAAAYAADIAYSAANVASHASVSASAAARAASIAASRAAANESLRGVTNRPSRRGMPRHAPSSGSAAPHAG